jgi:hypothetical protein
MDAAERALLEKTVGDAVDGAAASGGAVDDVLYALGWLEMLAAEPLVAIEIVFRAIGAANATSSVLDDVMVAGLGLAPRPDLAVMLPAFAASSLSDAGGLATSRAAQARELLVVAPDNGALIVPAANVVVRAVEGIDPRAGLHEVHVARGSGDAVSLEPGAWENALARGRVALAYEAAGACATMLDLARTHALERLQFDRPIARFQAVRHRLADAFVAVEALDAVLVAATDEPGAMTAALAKAIAGRTARMVGAHCQQVLAGIGFTTDHPFHRFLKRTMILDGLLDTADHLARDLGRQLLASREVPTLIEL